MNPPSAPPLSLPRPTRIRVCAHARAAAESSVRAWFRTHPALEVQVPSLVPCPGMEPHLRAFRVPAVEAKALGERWLHTSPEYAIKATFGELETDVFTLARAYRDEPPGRWHHPEFTMLEWYRRDAGLEALMHDCEGLVRGVVDALAGDAVLRELLGEGARDGVPVDAPFERISCEEAFRRWAGVDVLEPNDAVFAEAARRAGWDVAQDWDRETVHTVLLTDAVEPNLGRDRPAFLWGFPAWQSALARIDPSHTARALRFELYVPGTWERPPWRGGIELANAFDELTCASEQRARFEQELAWRAREGRDVYAMPEALLAGLERMPATAGIALGLERLVVWSLEALWGTRVGVGDLLLGEPVRWREEPR